MSEGEGPRLLTGLCARSRVGRCRPPTEDAKPNTCQADGAREEPVVAPVVFATRLPPNAACVCLRDPRSMGLLLSWELYPLSLCVCGTEEGCSLHLGRRSGAWAPQDGTLPTCPLPQSTSFQAGPVLKAPVPLPTWAGPARNSPCPRLGRVRQLQAAPYSQAVEVGPIFQSWAN